VRARPFRRQQTVVPARTRVKLLCGLADQAIIRHHSLTVIGDTPYFHSLW